MRDDQEHRELCLEILRCLVRASGPPSVFECRQTRAAAALARLDSTPLSPSWTTQRSLCANECAQEEKRERQGHMLRHTHNSQRRRRGKSEHGSSFSLKVFGSVFFFPQEWIPRSRGKNQHCLLRGFALFRNVHPPRARVSFLSSSLAPNASTILFYKQGGKYSNHCVNTKETKKKRKHLSPL